MVGASARRPSTVVHQLWPYEGTFVRTPAGGFDDAALFAFAEAIPDNLRRRVASGS